MHRLESLHGRSALVTGASSGIGEALARRLGRAGARVALVARRTGELERVAAAIRAEGGEAWVLPCDVGEREQVDAAAARVLARWGGVDLLVNNAGFGRHRLFLDSEVEEIERLMRVNYLGAVYWTKALLPAMLERGEGWIAFMASVVGHLAPPEESAYAASKFALVGLAESLSVELEDAGVHVLTVCPGAIRTPFFDAQALARLPWAVRRSMADPEALVTAILRALARGRRRLTHPRVLAAAFVVRELLPGPFRRGMKRATGPALPEGRARSGAIGPE